MNRRNFLIGATATSVAAYTMYSNPLTAMGKLPTSARKTRILASPQYRDGSFKNDLPTPDIVPPHSYWSVAKAYTETVPNKEPAVPIVVSSPNFSLPKQEADPILTWLGHSTYVLQWPGFNLVMDPVFHRCSPVSFAGPKPYQGMDNFSIDSLPEVIDVLILSHDHYDHLDYLTLVAIQPRVKHIVTSLGVGEHLEHWGFDPMIITELDWWEKHQLGANGTITATPARHFSGRGFTRNQTLWSSFVLERGDKRYFIGGDSGYGPHFKTIGDKLGPFDWAFLECGQYHPAWGLIHMLPAEVPMAVQDLQAERLVPVHWAKFTLALHPWTEPAELVLKAAKALNQPIYFPLPGASAALSSLDDNKWWDKA